MLVVCPECELKVSDLAVSCPHCGYPLKPTKVKSSFRNKRRRRLPNGFGQISEIKGRFLRKPFRAMVTVGKNTSGKPIAKLLQPVAYFETYNEAYEALVQYNQNPNAVVSKITMLELYESWMIQYEKTLANPKATLKGIRAAWKYCVPIYKTKVQDLTMMDVVQLVENGQKNDRGVIKEASPLTKTRIKTILSQMLDHAINQGIVEKNYARMYTIPKHITTAVNDKKHHLSFSESEMKILWENIGSVAHLEILLFQCYAGLRPQEIGKIKVDNVFLDDDYMILGMKTAAGTNRIVPIHPRIKFIVEEKYKEAKKVGSSYLFNIFDYTPRGSLNYELTYERYGYVFKNIMDTLGLSKEHKPHDGRKQFITMAKAYKMDEYAIKRIVGHKLNDLTEEVYTDRSHQWLLEEIKKIP